MMKWKPFFISLLLYCSLTACEQPGEKYCKELESRFNDPALQEYLVSWVDTNIVGREIAESEVLLGGGMVPGRFWLPEAEVEWEKFSFWERSQVRLIGSSITELESIFFGERSRRGVLVRMPDSLNFGLDESELRPVSDRVAIYCMKD